MELTNELADNILTMINSDDEDNMYIGFKSLEKFTIKGPDIGYLVYIFKYGKPDIDVWQENCKKHFKVLEEIVTPDKPLTYARGLSYMISNQVKSEIIELYLERHVNQLVNMLEGMGYPVDHLEFNLKLRK